MYYAYPSHITVRELLRFFTYLQLRSMRKQNVFTSCKTAMSITIMAAFILCTLATKGNLRANDSNATNTEPFSNVSFEFDLALQKRLIGTSTPRIGDIVEFEITVINEGDHFANGYTITDDISDGFEFLPSENPGWVLDGNVIRFTETTFLVGGESRSYPVRLRLLQGGAFDFVNIAEISEAIDNFGNTDSDIDSTPDDDILTDPQTEDDIDQDFVRIYDLALINMLDCPIPSKNLHAGENACFTMRVMNQGNVETNNISVINYGLPGFTFDPVLNPDWKFVGSGYINSSIPTLAAGQSHNISICFNIGDDIVDGTYVNEAEITSGGITGFPLAQDYDSVPDDVLGNDVGGVVSTINDNNISGDGTDDEDDHDPALVSITHVDLALTKTSDSQLVKPGQLVDFNITVINQGSERIEQVRLIDYLPEFTSLEDDSWHMLPEDTSGRTVYQDVKFPNGLRQGEEYTVSISLRLDDDIQPMVLINFAEIGSATDMDGNDISDLDVDSNLDSDNDNDNGGEPNSDTDNQVDNDGTVDEDDHDPAQIFFFNIAAEGPVCNMDAGINVAGTFSQRINVVAPVGQTWTVDNVNNFYDASSLDANSLIEIPVGTVLTPGPLLPNGVQEYFIDGIHVDGDAFSIRFVNENLDFDVFESPGASYEQVLITSDQEFAVCEGTEATYTIPFTGDCPMYTWYLVDNAAPTNPPVMLGSGISITTTWTTLGNFSLYAFTQGCLESCVSTAVTNIQVGNTGGQIQCISDINLSLGLGCETIVTPEMILAGEPVENASYAVELLFPNGEVIPNATITDEHLGHEIIARLVDGCSGNICWTTLTIEDKVAPIIDCSDTQQFCHQLEEYLPFVEDNCTGFTLETISEIVEAVDCDDTFIKTVFRTYQATDDFGNTSQPCTQRIDVLRFPLDDIQPPPIFGGLEPTSEAPIQCNDVVLDDEGRISTELTGVPTIDGLPLYPLEIGSFCKIGISFSDFEVETFDCGQKIVRTWTVYEDFCPGMSGAQWTFAQTIEIQDTEAPSLEVPADFTVSSNLPDCEASVTIPPAVVSDNCSDPVVVNITYPFGDILENQNGGNITLPFGEHVVTYTAIDPCGNMTSDFITVTVEDAQTPTAICEGLVFVGLREDGTAEVFAPAFDEGSTDNCKLDFMQVRRVDSVCPGTTGELEFGDFVSFCCDDISFVNGEAQPVIVEFAVWDQQGLMSSICEIEVIVQDKHGPQLTAPADITLSCTENFSLDAVLAMEQPTVFDACGGSSFDAAVIDSNIVCNDGFYVIEYTAKDGVNTVTATQTVTVVNDSPFNINTVSFPGNLEFVNTSCAMMDLTPEALNSFPTFTNTSCDFVFVADPIDNVFNQVDSDNTCFKIIRTWTVINDCTGESRTQDQLIQMINTIDPVITPVNLPAEFTAIECDGTNVSFAVSGDDDCSGGDLTFSYQLDANDDGVFSLPEEALVEGAGATINYSDILPIGAHSITFTFVDQCNNATSIVHEFMINDEVAPDPPVCVPTTIAIAPWEDANGEITTEGGCIMDVSSILSSMTHSCPDEELTVSFDSVNIVTEMCFFCEDIGLNLVPVYVIDSDGDFASCMAEITVEDNNDHPICSEIDLALTKTLDEAASDLPAMVGGNVTFLINVENQGTATVTDVSIVDYIPTGYVFNTNGNPGWVFDFASGTATFDLTGLSLMEGESLAPIPIELIVVPGANPDNLVNVAEITFVQDVDGNTNDIDSDPDDVNDDTIGGDDVTDNTNDDEDDHDPETISFFDLALIKTLSTVGPFTIGQDVSFEITVFNQGNETVDNIDIVDYIPCGFSFANSSTGLNPAWTDNGDGTASTTIPGPLAPGASTSLSLNLELNNLDGVACDPVDAWTNIAEISDFDDADGNFINPNDFDSTDDSNNDDVIGGDNEIDNNGFDEDDHDPADVDIFDLALDKNLVSTGAFEPGDVVQFDITVTNQGNVVANNVEVVDYIQCGFAFNLADNPTWSQVGMDDPTKNIPTIPVGGSMTVSIFLEILPESDDCPEYKNIAEISEDNNGDIDSTPGNNDMMEDDIGMDILTLCPTMIITEDFTICADDATVTLEATPTGGTWSGMGVDPVTGVFDPAGLTGEIVITYSEQCDDMVTITVVEPLDVILEPTATACNGDDFGSAATELDLFSFVNDGSGTWFMGTIEIDPADAAMFSFAGFAPGDVAFTYIVEATEPCDDFMGTLTVTVMDCTCDDIMITPQADLCADDLPVTLIASPTGGTWSGNGIVDTAAGIFDPAVAGVGTHPVSYSVGDVACVETIMITVVEPLSVELIPTTEVCNGNDFGDAPVVINLFDFVDNDTGVWTYADPPSIIDNIDAMNFSFDGELPGDHVFTYTVEGSNPCDDFVGTLTVTILDCICDDIVITPQDDLCADDLPVTLIASPTGGTWSGVGIVDSIAGIFDPVIAGAGVHEVSYSVENEACVASIMITVIAPLDINLMTEVDVCNSEVNGNLPTSIELTDLVDDQTGVWTDSDGNLVTNTLIDFTGADINVDVQFTYTIAGPAPCDDFVGMVTIDVLDCNCPMIDVTITGDAEICEGASTDLMVSATGADVTFLWSTGETTETITVMPATTTTFSVTATDITNSACTGSAEFTVTVIELLDPVCPPDILDASCEDFMDEENFDTNFGTIDLTGTVCGETLMIDDVIMALDCDNPDTLIRTFTVTNENGISASCTQTVITAEACGIASPIELICSEIAQFVEDPECDGQEVDITEFFDFNNIPSCCGEPEFTFEVDPLAGVVIDGTNISFPDPGSFDITVFASDDCGADTCEFQVVLADTLELRCNKIITFIDEDGTTEFNPWDFILGGSEMDGVIDFGNILGCGGEVTVPIDSASFDPAVFDTLLIVDCDSINTVVEFNIFAFSALGVDTCLAAYFLNDFPAPNNICPDNANDNGNITGLISTEEGDEIENVTVKLNGSGEADVSTSEFGFYAFPAMPMGGNYLIEPAKDHDDLNGVSTLDIIKIQRHVLGLEILDSPYKIIAADVNRSDVVTILDAVELRKLVLGIYNEIPQNTSWRMVQSDHVFADPADPFLFDIPETYSIQSLNSSLNVDFVGVKIGDVNGNASPNSFGTFNAETRSGETYILTVEDEEEKGISKARFGSDSETSILGFQMTLNFDRFNTYITDVVPNEEISDYFGAFIGDGYITISLALPNEMDASSLAYFFEVEYDGSIDKHTNNFDLSSEILTSEAYTFDGIVNLRLDNVEEAIIFDSFTVAQNKPNPWSNETLIDINLPTDGNVNMLVFSSDGKLVYEFNEYRHAGFNQILISESNLAAGGIYHYKVTAGNQTVTKRFLLLK